MVNSEHMGLEARSTEGAFPTLDTDLGEGSGGGGETRKRVCIATPDIVGPVKNGGIGTAYHHLARLLSGWGHEVVVAYVNGNADEERLMGEARTFYEGFGVGFEPIVPRPASGTALAQVSTPAWALYDWLRGSERCFDILHVSDWHGLGYGALLAKSLGLALGGTHIVVHAHGPTLWNVEGNRQLLSDERELGWVFMERRSVELADTLVCGSAHLLGWMRDAGYAMPARSFVWPNPFPAPERSPEAAAERATRDAVELEEVVFFGRLEPRKGLVLFVDAIDRLVRQGRAPARVTFLGAAARRFDGPGLIGNCERDWPVEVRAITDRNAKEAVAYLSQPGRLAVLPSLQENSSLAVTECLHAGIPFLAAATGGTPELVAKEDRERALVAPEHIALGERIAALGAAPLRAVRPRWDFERSQEVWSRWHAQSAPFEAAAVCFAHHARRADAETPLVTVCITHHERPALLGMAVDSVFAQDYPALEAVLVDDGSESAEALAALVEIERRFSERGWRVIRQQNRFKGAARNVAAGAARGEWLLFLDDDNVLFPDAVTRLVRAARFSGAHCVPAASIRFTGDGDPRTDTASHGTPIRFLGAARAWSRFRNVVGDTCALVRQDAFMAVGGFTEEYRVGLDDLSFFNHLILAGYRTEPIPDPIYFYRIANTSTKRLNRSGEVAQFQVLASQFQELSDEERAFTAYAIACICNRQETANNTHRAEDAMRREDWETACALWAEVRHTFPEHSTGFAHGAEALLHAGHLEEAHTVAVEATTRFPNHFDGHYHRAQIAMQRGDWEAACTLCARLRDTFPERAAGFTYGIEALLHADRLEEAEEVAHEAAARFPDRFHSHYHRAQIAMRRGDWETACIHWAELRQSFPDRAAGFMRGAEALICAGRLQEAEKIAAEAVARFPDLPEGYRQQADIAMRCSDWEDACALWAELRKRFPDHAAGFVRGAEALLHAGHLEDAEAIAAETIARFPDLAGGFHQRAEILMRRGGWEAACTLWAQLREAFPDRAAGFVRGAQALQQAGRLEEAEAAATEAVARFPDHVGGYNVRANLAMRCSDWKAACDLWAETRMTFPDHAAGFVRGAEALLLAERLEEAHDVAAEAVRRFPQSFDGHYHLGRIAVRRGDWQAAVESWTGLRHAFPDRPAGYVRGAEALLQTGRLEEAEALASEAIMRFPSSAGGHFQRAEIAMRRGDWTTADARWTALRRAFPKHREGFVLGAALTCGQPCSATDIPVINILIDPEWRDWAQPRDSQSPFLDVRCNGRVIAQAYGHDLSEGLVELALEKSTDSPEDTLYSVHDAGTGKTLAVLTRPTPERVPHIIGTLENRPRPELRGWILDSDCPERARRVAIGINGRLTEVIDATKQRNDIALWKGSEGFHGFMWRIPESLSKKESASFDVFDAETGRPLRGSPVHLEHGRAIASR